MFMLNVLGFTITRRPSIVISFFCRGFLKQTFVDFLLKLKHIDFIKARDLVFLLWAVVLARLVVKTCGNPFVCRSYLLLIRKERTASSRSSFQQCKDDRDCYIAAELKSEIVDNKGDIFYIGDEKEYGEYVNRALEPETRYSAEVIVVAFSAKVRY